MRWYRGALLFLRLGGLIADSFIDDVDGGPRGLLGWVLEGYTGVHLWRHREHDPSGVSNSLRPSAAQDHIRARLHCTKGLLAS